MKRQRRFVNKRGVVSGNGQAPRDSATLTRILKGKLPEGDVDWAMRGLQNLAGDRPGPRDFVPLSVREGTRWARARWRWLMWRERVALRLAPWLDEAGALADAKVALDHLVQLRHLDSTEYLLSASDRQIALAALAGMRLRSEPKEAA